MARSPAEAVGTPRRVGARAGAPLAVAVLAAACAAAGGGPLLLHPAPPAADGYRLDVGALVFEGRGISVTARPMDWRLVEEELRAAGPNPFGDGEAGTGRFVFIRLRVENRSAETLVLNPLRATLLHEERTPYLPVEHSDLLMLSGSDPAAAARGAAFRRCCLDQTLTLRAGGSAERYLVFRSPGREGEMSLVLDEVWLGTSALELRFPFEAFPGR